MRHLLLLLLWYSSLLLLVKATGLHLCLSGFKVMREVFMWLHLVEKLCAVEADLNRSATLRIVLLVLYET